MGNIESQEKPAKKNKIRKILLGVLIGFIVLFVAVLLCLNMIVATSVRTAGPHFTGTEVGVKSVNISLLGGNVGINDFFVGNPEGYSTPEAIRVGRVSVDMDVSSLLGGNEIIINEIIIDAPKISMESSITFSSNLGDIKAHLDKVTASSTPADEKADAKEEEMSAEEQAAKKRVVISKLVISNGTVVLANKELGMSVPIPLPTITLTDIGKEKEVTMSQAISHVYNELLKAVISAVNLAGLGESVTAMTKGLNDAVSASFTKTGEAISAVGASAGDAVDKTAGAVKDAAGKTADAIGDGVKGLGDKLGF